MKTKTVFNKDFLYGTIVLFLVVCPYAILFFQNPEQRINYTQEDGIIENLSAIFFLLASIVFLFLFFKSRTEDKIYFLKRNRNYFFLLLGLLLFFCFGEEISWGQRIFNIMVPDQWKAINTQQELNFHNLYIFQGNVDGNIKKTGIALWITAPRIFLLIWFFYCLMIPIAIKFSPKLRLFSRKIYFPIVPIWLGFLFLLNQIICSSVSVILQLKDRQPSVEIKETNYGFLYLLVGIYFYISYRKSKSLVNHKKSVKYIESHHRFSFKF